MTDNKSIVHLVRPVINHKSNALKVCAVLIICAAVSWSVKLMYGASFIGIYDFGNSEIRAYLRN